MARIRTIKPAFFTSLTVASLPLSARLTFIGLWTYADDEGRGVDDPRLVKAEVWPLDDDMTTRKIDRDLTRLADEGLILRYVSAGRPYLQVTNWTEHQRVNRPTPSKLPALTVDSTGVTTPLPTEPVVSPHATLTEDSLREGKGREGKGEGTPPTPPPSGGHDGQHSNCRPCGTNRRGSRPPTEPRTALPPSSAPEHIADLDPPAPQRIDPHAAQQGRARLADVRASLHPRVAS